MNAGASRSETETVACVISDRLGIELHAAREVARRMVSPAWLARTLPLAELRAIARAAGVAEPPGDPPETAEPLSVASERLDAGHVIPVSAPASVADRYDNGREP